MIEFMPSRPASGRFLDPLTSSLRARARGNPSTILQLYGGPVFTRLSRVEEILDDDQIYEFIELLGAQIGARDPSGFPFEVTINLARSYDDPCLGMTSVDAQLRIASMVPDGEDLLLGHSDGDLFGLIVGALLTADAYTVVEDVFAALVDEYDRLVLAATGLELRPATSL